jgi:hypothetical protein
MLLSDVMFYKSGLSLYTAVEPYPRCSEYGLSVAFDAEAATSYSESGGP